MNRKVFSNKTWFCIWAAYHALILIAFCISLFFTKGLVFDADFTNMIPSANKNEAIKIAEKTITQNSSRSIFILSEHTDFEQAKLGAQKAFEILKKRQDKFNSLSLYTDESAFSEIYDFLREYRFNLLDLQTQNNLRAKDGAQKYAQNALATVYGGFSFTSLDNLAEDPFLLDEINLKNYLSAVTDSGTKLSPKDGVLARFFNDKWYVMIRGELNEKAARLADKENAIPLIYENLLPLENDELHFVFYGSPFHSYKSSSSASVEISVISTVSMIAVILILLIVFKSPFPVFLSVFSILCSILSAVCATHFIFGGLHMTSLVFGTSLIGSCIDYSLHYFINWKASKEFDTTAKIRHHIFKGLLLSLVSTEICFAMLLFAPFGLLKQMAVFSISGILSSFLTTAGFFPVFNLPAGEKRGIQFIEKIENFSNKTFTPKTKKYAGRLLSLAVFSVCIPILFFNRQKLSVKNDISNLYKMEGRLKEDTIKAYQILDYSPSSWIIVSADSEEELLQKEENIASILPDKYLCTSRFIPSVQMQKQSIESSKLLLPFVNEQFENLGFEENDAQNYKNTLKDAEKKFVTVDAAVPDTLNSLLKMLWIGKIEEKYYSIILPSAISDEFFYKNLCNTFDGVCFENKVKDISLSLDKLTELIVIMFALAFVIIFLIIKIFYNWRETLKIISIPVLSVLVILTVFVLAGLKIEFFCITGMILVFGLGLDYVIYKSQNKENTTETFAIGLSFITTAISFGALALSSFVPVHVIGLAIFSGLATAFFCAIL